MSQPQIIGRSLLPTDASAEQVCAEADALYRARRYLEAINAYTRALKLQPSAAAYYGRASAYKQLRQFKRALADYKLATELDLTNATYHYYRAAAELELQQYEPAITDYEQAIALGLSEHVAAAHNNAAFAQQQLKLYRAALAHYDEAIALNPNYATAYTNRGLVHSYLGDYPAALLDHSRAAQLEPDNASIIYNMAWTYALKREPVASLALLQRAITLKRIAREIAKADIADFQWLIDNNPAFAASFRKLVYGEA